MASHSEPARITITICGDGGCGKSSITLRLVRSVWTSSYDPTIEDSYTITRLVDGRPYLLSLTDTAGQEEYRGMWAGANMASDAFLLVYDITSSNSLDALGEFVDMVDMESETRQEHNTEVLRKSKSARKRSTTKAPPSPADDIKPLPVKIIAGNKCDLQQSRQVDAKTGLEWARARGCGFMETSARNVVNIEETFALIVRRVVEARRVAAQERALALGVSLDAEGRPLNAHPQGGLGGNRALPPQGLDFSLGRGGADGRGMHQGLGTRRAVTAPLSPLPVLEKGEKDGEGNRRMARGADGGRWRFRGGAMIGGRRKLRGLLCF